MLHHSVSTPSASIEEMACRCEFKQQQMIFCVFFCFLRQTEGPTGPLKCLPPPPSVLPFTSVVNLKAAVRLHM